MLSGGKKVIVGTICDPAFGPILMFGPGGLMRNPQCVRFAISPVNEKEARKMITGIKAYPLLAGARGSKSSDIDALVDAILRVSRLVCNFPEIEEFEINPLMFLKREREFLQLI